MVLCVCASCGKYYGSVKDVASGMEDKDDTAALHNDDKYWRGSADMFCSV